MTRSILRAARLAFIALPLMLPGVLSSGEALAQKKDASSADAPKQKKTIALGAITGNKPKQVREWVRSALGDRYELTDAEDFKPKGDDASYAKMASDLGVEFVAVGKIEQNRLVMSIRNGATGKLVQDVEVRGALGPKLKKAISEKLAKNFADALGETKEEERAARKKAEEEERAEEAQTEEEGAEEEEDEEGAVEEEVATEEEAAEDAPSESQEEPSKPVGAAATPLKVLGGARFYSRKFAFNDTLPEIQPGAVPVRPLRDYELGLGPALILRLAFYPGVLLKADGFATNVALIGGFEQGIATTSQYNGADPTIPAELSNVSQEWFVGLRLRFPIKTSEFGVEGAYGEHRYFLKGDSTTPIVPDVTYRYVKLGGDGELGFGKFLVGAHLAGRLLFGTGSLERSYWFPNAAGMAIDAGLYLGFRVIEPLAILAGGDFVRYGLDFNPVSSESIAVAGGATDQYLSGWLGVRFQLPDRAASN